MARKRQPKVTAKDIKGLKYFRILQPFLQRLHDAGTERDRAGNRKLFFDQYGALLLLYFFSPILTSLRGLRRAEHPDPGMARGKGKSARSAKVRLKPDERGYSP